MLIDDKHLLQLADAELFEPLQHFQADPSHFEVHVRRLLPGGWQVIRDGVWVHCHAPGALLPPQGWKIHLSATDANATAILTMATRLLAGRGVPFKFAADRALLHQINSKRWPRGGAGKFVTVYPSGTGECGELLDALHRDLYGYQGPYILSDRRYRDSRVVYYRYGGIAPAYELDVCGRKVPVMHAPEGGVLADERLPYFHLPPGVGDPFSDGPERDHGEPGTLKDGRYLVQSVIAFSNSGGVYRALDRETGELVLVKEARPHTAQTPQGTDAVWMLKKEHRLLRLLEDARVAPRPLDYFHDWEHAYLVQEFVRGLVLRGSNTAQSLALRTRAARHDAEAFFDLFRRLYSRIAAALRELHRRGIVFGDISTYNVIVLEGSDEVRLIDFEGAYEEGVDPPMLMFTPGFSPAAVREEGRSRREDDLYGLGGLMLAGLTPINALLGLHPAAHAPFLDALRRDLGLPDALASLVSSLLDPARDRRPGLDHVLEVLAADHAVGEVEVGAYEADACDLPALLQQMVGYLQAAATFERTDRLFPADAEVFDSNPLSVAHGACGVAYVLQRLTGRVPPEVAEWILAHPLSPDAYPPGLYTGLTGIAWTLLEMGLRDEAEAAARMAGEHPLRWESPDLFQGAAGWGMGRLRFFLETGDEEYLDQAREAGRLLLERREEEDGLCSWRSVENGLACGLAHGAAGVSLFLLYLTQATSDPGYAEVGGRGLDFAAAHPVRTSDGALSWRAREHEPTYTPYWRWGSAGIGATILRYRRALGETRWDAVLDGLFPDVDRKYTIYPGRFFGLAGLGDYLLDLAHFGGDEAAALRSARRTLAGILLFRLERPGGIAFPGESLSRISCDYGTGSAGIALFLHRLLTRGRPAFMLDELLEPRGIPLPRIRAAAGALAA